jgi:L-rhamnose mutarotase
MIRRAFTMRLKPDALAEYKRHHDNIWPELVLEIERAGIASITTFQRGLDLFLVSEITDEEAWDRLWNSAVHKRWAEVMEPLMYLRDDGIVDASVLTEVFHIAPNGNGQVEPMPQFEPAAENRDWLVVATSIEATAEPNESLVGHDTAGGNGAALGEPAIEPAAMPAKKMSARRAHKSAAKKRSPKKSKPAAGKRSTKRAAKSVKKSAKKAAAKKPTKKSAPKKSAGKKNRSPKKTSPKKSKPPTTKKKSAKNRR